jgi:Asp-tRNA(Asn)/Glu-tRNA(Gln) amidotransferase A subunit family amidase
MGASVEDVTMVYQIIAGPDPQDSMSQQQPPVSIDGWNTPDLNGLRLGIYQEWFHHANPEIVKSNEKMLAEFEKAGAILVNVTIPELDAMRVAHAVTILSEMASSMKNNPNSWKDFAPATRLSLELGKEMRSHDYIQAQRMRTRGIHNFSRVFKEADVILTPTTAMTGPLVPPAALAKGLSDLSTDTEMMRFVFPGNLLGLPAISFPVGYDQDGMPIGMQAIGNYWTEALLLRVAYNAELTFTRTLPKNYFGIMI